MKFFSAAAAIFALCLTVVSAVEEGPNPIRKPSGGEILVAGTEYTVTWDPTTSGNVKLLLRKGLSANLENLGAIASNIPNTGTYQWSISSDLVEGDDYALEIQGTDGIPNYTGLFTIQSDIKAKETSSSSVAASTTEKSSSATSTAIKTTTTAPANTTTVLSSTSTLITSTMVSNLTTTVSSHGNSTVTSYTKTSTKATTTATTTGASSTPSETGAATRVSGAGALMAAAAFAAVFAL